MKKRSYEMWAALLILMAVLAVIVLFGALVEKGATEDRAPAAARAAYFIARLPANAKGLIDDALSGANPRLADAQRFDGVAGFERLAPTDAPGAMLALSRYDGNAKRGVIEFLDIRDGRVLSRLTPDISAINAQSTAHAEFIKLARDRGPSRYLPTHPLPTEDGGVVFNGMYTPLVRLDACGNIVWVLNVVFHHSIEKDADGNYWGPSLRMPAAVRLMPKSFLDDSIAEVSPDGRLLYQKSVADLLIENGYRRLVYSVPQYTSDPLHLNDIQPVLKSGPYWKKGDLFISLRHPSAVLLYRPATNKILWLKQGPWLFQHDVNIIDDHRISVFSNNMTYQKRGRASVEDNEIIVFDFSSGKLSEPWRSGFEKNEIRTLSEGRGRVLANGEVYVEEQNYGRILQMNAAGDERWRYVNRAADGRVYQVGWTRYLPPTMAAPLRKALAERQCGAA
ncbi:MAG: arylsulfotransferase family protein [Parvularculaceae bacterium]